VASANNADLQRARAAVEEARANSKVSRASRWPELDVFARGQAWTDTDGNNTAEWNAGLSLGYPLFTGRARHHRITGADAAVRQAEARVRQIELELERNVDMALSDAEQARARSVSLQSAVSRFLEVKRIRLLALDTGTGTQTDYLDAEAELLEARARLIEARHREIASRSALAWHTGQLDLDWLHHNLEDR
jgi:outer membrane protein TolC